MRHEAIRKIHPEVASIYEGDVWRCIDENEVEVTIDTTKVDAEEKKLQAEYDAQAYARTRAEQYPDLAEQLDLLYHDMTSDKGDKTGEWYKAVNKVKTDNPKG